MRDTDRLTTPEVAAPTGRWRALAVRFLKREEGTLSSRLRNVLFVLFLGGVLAYGAGFAWYMLARFDAIWLFLITPFYWIFDREAMLFAIKAFEIMLVAGGVALVTAAARLVRLPWYLPFAGLPMLYSLPTTSAGFSGRRYSAARGTGRCGRGCVTRGFGPGSCAFSG